MSRNTQNVPKFVERMSCDLQASTAERPALDVRASDGHPLEVKSSARLTVPDCAGVLSFRQLCQFFDTKQRATLERLLKKRGIKTIPDRRGRPITTVEVVTKAILEPERDKRLEFTRPPGPSRRPHRHGGAT